MKITTRRKISFQHKNNNNSVSLWKWIIYCCILLTISVTSADTIFGSGDGADAGSGDQSSDSSNIDELTTVIFDNSNIDTIITTTTQEDAVTTTTEKITTNIVDVDTPTTIDDAEQDATTLADAELTTEEEEEQDPTTLVPAPLPTTIVDIDETTLVQQVW